MIYNNVVGVDVLGDPPDGLCEHNHPDNLRFAAKKGCLPKVANSRESYSFSLLSSEGSVRVTLTSVASLSSTAVTSM